jgi:hypothetical protein
MVMRNLSLKGMVAWRVRQKKDGEHTRSRRRRELPGRRSGERPCRPHSQYNRDGKGGVEREKSREFVTVGRAAYNEGMMEEEVREEEIFSMRCEDFL